MKEIKKILSTPEIEIAGVGDKLQYLVHEMNDNTIRFVLRYPNLLSGEIMEQAVRAVVEGADVLHSTFIPGNLEAYWLENTDISSEDYFALIHTNDDPIKLAEREMIKAVQPQGKTQFHGTLILGGGESVLVVSISHLCVDGGDGKYLLEKLVEAYNLIAHTGSSKGLAVKNGSRSVFQVYKEFSRRETISAWMPSLSDVKTVFPFPEADAGVPSVVWHAIPASALSKIRAYGKTRGATVNDLLLTAFYRAFAALPEVDPQNPISIMSMMDLRRHCLNGESEGLCNMSGSLPTVLEQGGQGSFGDTLQKIVEQTEREKEKTTAGMAGMPLMHSTGKLLPLWLLTKAAHKVYGSMSLGLTNLGNLKGEALALDGICPVLGIFGGPLKKKPGMQISAVGLDGMISLCCIGEYGPTDAQLIRSLLEYIEMELTSLSAE